MKARIFIFTWAVGLFCYNSSAQEFSSPTIQIGVVVEDLEASVKFYTEVIGMQETGAFNVPNEMAKRLGLSEMALDVKVLKLEDSPNANEWKLMSFNKKAGHKKPKYIDDDTGMQYTTIFVTSMAPFLERIKANKVTLLGETPTELPDGQTFVLIQDPDGTFIELIGPK